jgi:hypothetical protein
LYRGVADFYAAAAKQNSVWIQPAIENVKQAIELGMSPNAFVSAPNYSELQRQPAFQDALKRRATTSGPATVVQFLDPLCGP